ncbi:hypothetical protein J6590_021736 [Homalodisca vitripennis]|nr:hypothetical protein J6590_021736 [Homalodisca vitripennis]
MDLTKQRMTKSLGDENRGKQINELIMKLRQPTNSALQHLPTLHGMSPDSHCYPLCQS